MHQSHIPQCTMFVTETWTHVHISVTTWCIVGYLFDVLWDLWDGTILITESDITVLWEDPGEKTNGVIADKLNLKLEHDIPDIPDRCSSIHSDIWFYDKLDEWHDSTQGSFCVCAQPLRDDVTM